MTKKFELTKETMIKYGRTFYRIRALTDIQFSYGTVKKGDLGGYIEDEKCLSQDGNAWVFENGLATKDSIIMGGVIRGGVIWGGVINGGVINGGVIRGGVIRGGVIWGGVIWGGEINDGVIRGGVINGGDVIEKSPIFLSGLVYDITITEKYITIGCEYHSHDDWCKFEDWEIIKMDGKDALKFWGEHKEMIMKLAKTQRGE